MRYWAGAEVAGIGLFGALAAGAFIAAGALASASGGVVDDGAAITCPLYQSDSEFFVPNDGSG
jgi:hypothetical protein